MQEIKRHDSYGYSTLKIGERPKGAIYDKDELKLLSNAFILDAVENYEAEPRLMVMVNKAFKAAESSGVFEKPMYSENAKYMHPDNYITNSSPAEYFVRMLSYYYPNMLMTKYPKLYWRDMCPVIRGDSFSKVEINQMYDMVGSVDSVDQLSGNFQMIDVSGKESSSKMQIFGLGVQWQTFELQADLMYNKIKPAKMEALQRNMDQLFNSMFYQGSSKFQITGVLTDPNIPRQPIAGGTWATKTPDQKLEDLITILNNMELQSLGVFSPVKLELSLNEFQDAFAVPRSGYVDTDIFQYIATKYPNLQSITGNPYLNGKGANGTGVAIAYDNSTPDNYHMNIPFENYPGFVNYKGLEIDFPFYAKTTGLVLNYAPSINVWDGL